MRPMRHVTVAAFSLWVWAACLLIGSRVAVGDVSYGTPTKVPNVPSGYGYPQISRDGLELYFAAAGTDQCSDIWVMRRSSTQEEWDAPVRLDAPVNSPWSEKGPCISPDGLELYFSDATYEEGACTSHPIGYGNGDLWVSRRASKEDPWGTPENLGLMVNSEQREDSPSLSADGLSLYFQSIRSSGYGYYDLYVSKRASKHHPWGPAVNVGPPVNTAQHEATPFLSPDGLSLFFSAGAHQLPFLSNIYVSRRETVDSPWGGPKLFEPVQLPGLEFHLSFSEKDSTIYFDNSSDFYGLYTLWRVDVHPVADFNGDGRVDGKDVLIMTASWGQDDSLCDIGPTAFGDGVVDLQDVVVLAEYIGQDVVDSTLVAHWALDETEGVVAYDSAGIGHGTVVRSPAWRPDDGQVNGAMEFNGTVFVVTNFTLSPAEGPFSAVAWIKGGQPGQRIVSRELSFSDWLMADPLEGKLATGLSTDQDGCPLCSDVVITDGNWHRIGVVWDGSTCMLCVDGVLVAQKAEEELTGSDGKVMIGSGVYMAPGTLWTGLIDDVRIYNRVVKP